MGREEEFTVKVRKNEVVTAILPIQEHWLPPSNLDLLLPAVDVGVFFCYKKPAGGRGGEDQYPFTFGSMVSVLKNTMAKTLVSYYAFAGEMVENSEGETELLCNNRGVDFIEAFAEVELQHLNLYNPEVTIEGKLVPKKKNGVLCVQATELKCGGLVVGCTFDHRVADAYSANMFLVSWADMAQLKPFTLPPPSFLRLALKPRHPPFYDASLDHMYVAVSAPPPPKPHRPNSDHPISRIYYIEYDQLIRLQSLSGGSKLEAFSAFLWKMISAGEVERDKSCRMGIVVDGRARLSDGESDKLKLMNAYFGNVLSIPFGKERAGDLKERPLSWVAERVHEFVQSAVTKEHFLNLIDWVEVHRPEPALAKIYATGGGGDENDGPGFVVSSGQRFPASKVDFGWGKAAFGSYHFPWGGESGYVMPMPSPLGNGDWVVYMHLLKKHLEFIETQATHVFRPLAVHYLNLS